MVMVQEVLLEADMLSVGLEKLTCSCMMEQSFPCLRRHKAQMNADLTASFSRKNAGWPVRDADRNKANALN